MRVRLPLVWLLAAALLVMGGASRLAGLGATPLSSAEAASALKAAAGAGARSPWDDTQDAAPAATSYLVPTETLMNWFGPSVGAARVVPAWLGWLLLALPLLMIRRWGWLRALLTMLLLGISPAAWALSRSAEPSALAVFGACLVLGAIVREPASESPPSSLLAIGLAIGFGAGAPFWMGCFGLLLAGLLWVALYRFNPIAPLRPGWSRALVTGILGAAGLLLVFGTRLGAEPGALAGATGGLGMWLAGWRGGGYPLLVAGSLLPIYEPLGLVGGVVTIVQVFRSGRNKLPVAAYWAGGSLVAFLVYPGREPADVIWIAVPLAILTARWLVQLTESAMQLKPAYPAALLAAVLTTVLVFAFFQWRASNAGFGLASLERQAQLGFAISAVGFCVALVLLFGFGWSWRETGVAASIVSALGLAAITVSAGWGLTFGQVDRRVELWRRETSTANLGLLEDNLDAFGDALVGRQGGLQIATEGPVPANLAWVLRAQRPAPVGVDAEPPPVVIAPASAEQPGLPADYLGQKFGIGQTWDWVGSLPPDFDLWLANRRAPTRMDSWVLYVRTDAAGLEDLLLGDGQP